jgi:hypothetical protein
VSDLTLGQVTQQLTPTLEEVKGELTEVQLLQQKQQRQRKQQQEEQQHINSTQAIRLTYGQIQNYSACESCLGFAV